MAENQLVLIHSNLQKLLKEKAKALPKNFNETRFLQNAMVVLQDTKGIEKMQPVSVARTMLKGAFLGLDFFNKEAYAIPYGDHLQFQTDYKGEIKLAKKYSIKKIQDIYAKLVRKGDQFTEYVDHGKQVVDFYPIAFNKAEIIGVFAVCYYQDGSMLYESMTVEEVNKVRDTYSKVPGGKAWKESYGEMVRKTCLRRLCKFIELEFDDIEQAKAYEDGADVEFTEEIPYEPIEMPKAIETPSENAPETVEDAPESEVTGSFLQWSELDEEDVKQALSALRDLYKENKDRMDQQGLTDIGKLLALFGVKSLTPKDMTPEQYTKIMNHLRG